MPINSILLLSIVFVPIIGAFILPLVAYQSEKIRNLLALLLVAIPLFFSLLLLPQVLAGNVIYFNFIFSPGVNLSFTADALALFMAVVSSLISLIIVIFSFDYISHYENQNEYYAMVVLFLGSMMGIIYSANLIFLYIFWEITAICSWRSQR